jgi:hypothetical protein
MVLLNSCSKEDVLTNDVENSTLGIEKVVFNLPDNGRSSGNSTSMLQFNTFEDFLNTYATLENALENHQDIFYTQHEQIDDDAFEAMELQAGFNDYQPLIDFKEQQGFTNSMFDLV